MRAKSKGVLREGRECGKGLLQHLSESVEVGVTAVHPSEAWRRSLGVGHAEGQQRRGPHPGQPSLIGQRLAVPGQGPGVALRALHTEARSHAHQRLPLLLVVPRRCAAAEVFEKGAQGQVDGGAFGMW